MNEEKEVYFDQYCKSCKHHGLEESKDPCNDCLAEPGNTNSHKPMNYESKNNKEKRNMNLEEFRKALSSDATEENTQLKRQLSDLQTEYHEKLSKLENENDSLKESCRVLCNRCFTLTRGVTCLFCGLDYPCPHMPGLEEQVAMAHKLRKEIEKNG